MSVDTSRLHVVAVILNWNGWPLTSECLTSLLSSSHMSVSLVLLDNASQDDSWNQCLKWFDQHVSTDAKAYSRLRSSLKRWQSIADLRIGALNGFGHRHRRAAICRTTENLGFADGCNVAADIGFCLEPDYILFLNNDAVIKPNAIHELLAVSVEADADLVGGRIFNAVDNRTQFMGSRWPHLLFGIRQFSIPKRDTRFWTSADANGAALLASVAVLRARIERVGHIFDPAYFMYCEETDFCQDAIKHSVRCVVAAEARVYHSAAGSSGGLFNARSYYYLSRNRVRLARNHLTAPLRYAFYAWFIASRIAVAARWTLRGKLATALAILSGAWEGFRGKGGKWASHDTV